MMTMSLKLFQEVNLLSREFHPQLHEKLRAILLQAFAVILQPCRKEYFHMAEEERIRSEQSIRQIPPTFRFVHRRFVQQRKQLIFFEAALLQHYTKRLVPMRHNLQE